MAGCEATICKLHQKFVGSLIVFTDFPQPSHTQMQASQRNDKTVKFYLKQKFDPCDTRDLYSAVICTVGLYGMRRPTLFISYTFALYFVTWIFCQSPYLHASS